MHPNRELMRQIMRRFFLLPLLLLPAVACGNAAEGDHELGSVDFDVSCVAEVRDDFDSAVALLHHMMYVESQAARSRKSRSEHLVVRWRTGASR